MFPPGGGRISPVVAVAQANGASGRRMLTAAVAGYEVGIRVGEFLGRSHYKVFHTTGTAGTVAAAAAVGNLLDLDAVRMLHAFGSAGTQAAGLWEFLRDAADSKQLHVAKAAADGLMSAYVAAEGFTGAKRIFEGAQGMAAGMSRDADPAKLTDRLGDRWALTETSFKYHASCRHTHPAADALLSVMTTHHLTAEAIHSVTAGGTRPRSMCSVCTKDGDGATVQVLDGHRAGADCGLRTRGAAQFESHFDAPAVAAFREKVVMVLTPRSRPPIRRDGSESHRRNG